MTLAPAYHWSVHREAGNLCSLRFFRHRLVDGPGRGGQRQLHLFVNGTATCAGLRGRQSTDQHCWLVIGIGRTGTRLNAVLLRHGLCARAIYWRSLAPLPGSAFSEVETLSATLFEPLPSCHSPKADPCTIADDRFCRQSFGVNYRSHGETQRSIPWLGVFGADARERQCTPSQPNQRACQAYLPAPRQPARQPSAHDVLASTKLALSSVARIVRYALTLRRESKTIRSVAWLSCHSSQGKVCPACQSD